MKKAILAVILAVGLFAGHTQVAQVVAQTILPTTSEKTIIKGKIINLVHKVDILAIRGEKGVVLLRYKYDTEGLDHIYKGMSAIITAHKGESGFIADSIQPDLAVIPKGVEKISILDLENTTRTLPTSYSLIDVRPTEEFEEAHIPTAISIPFTELQEKKELLLPTALKESDKSLIFYCGDVTCSQSTKAASMAVQLGYTDVRVLLYGTSSWKQMGQRQVSSDSFVNNGNIVLIDLRDPAEYEAGHIPRAVNIPFDTLKKDKSRLPSKRSASIVLYGSSHEDEAVKMIRGWRYKHVSLVENGLQGYVGANNVLIAGKGSTEINWERQVRSGEVAFDDVETAVSQNGPALILDVRNKNEVEKGTLPNAVNIPLDQLEARMSEIDKDREIYIHCASGARAKMASLYLNDHGFKTKYLVGRLEVEEDDSYACLKMVNVLWQGKYACRFGIVPGSS